VGLETGLVASGSTDEAGVVTADDVPCKMFRSVPRLVVKVLAETEALLAVLDRIELKWDRSEVNSFGESSADVVGVVTGGGVADVTVPAVPEAEDAGEDGLSASTPVGKPLDCIPLDGTPLDGIPLDGTPLDGTPLGGAPLDGAPLGGAPLDGTLLEAGGAAFALPFAPPTVHPGTVTPSTAGAGPSVIGTQPGKCSHMAPGSTSSEGMGFGAAQLLFSSSVKKRSAPLILSLNTWQSSISPDILVQFATARESTLLSQPSMKSPCNP
jgi:hypothetical protein